MALVCFFTQFWPRGSPDMPLLRLHWRLSVFQTKITRFVGNSRTNRKETHPRQLFQTHAKPRPDTRISRFFLGETQICHFSCFLSFQVISGSDGGLTSKVSMPGSHKDLANAVLPTREGPANTRNLQRCIAFLNCLTNFFTRGYLWCSFKASPNNRSAS